MSSKQQYKHYSTRLKAEIKQWKRKYESTKQAHYEAMDKVKLLEKQVTYLTNRKDNPWGPIWIGITIGAAVAGLVSLII